MGYDTIHETSVSDVAVILRDGIQGAKDGFTSKAGTGGEFNYGSLSRLTKGLVMEFPVLVSKANHIESAGIVAKAYEAKFVTMLQLAFTALNITSAKDGFEYIKNFHTNLGDKFSVDDLIGVLDSYATAKHESGISADTYAKCKAVMEDMRNLSFYFEDEISVYSLESYNVMKGYNSLRVVREDIDSNIDDYQKSEAIKAKTANDNEEAKRREERDRRDAARDTREKERLSLDRHKDSIDTKRLGMDMKKDARDAEKLTLDKDKAERDTKRLDMDTLKDERDRFTNYLVPSEIKKANELVPTMMIINFTVNDPKSGYINKQMVIGVKAKLYEVEPMDVINKIITKNVDNNVLLKLVKVSTREISFVKDFLLAIDDAKLDALSKSKRGSTNKLFKVLERRALGGKIRKMLRMNDYARAISSLVISQEEAEELLKNNIDVSNPKVIRPIMEKLNLISFAIIDETSESVKFIFDTGDDVFETIPFSKLEKEQKDGMSKKVINLLAKMNR